VQKLLSDVNSSLDASKSVELDDEPPPADGVTEEAEQPVTDNQDDEPDPVETEFNGNSSEN